MNEAKRGAEDPRVEAVLEAALDIFSAYGYRRTTMGDLARGAGMSRPALYLLFPNKEVLFRALAQRLLSRQLAAATDALDRHGPAAQVLENAILARDLEIFRLFAASPHGDEVAAEGNARIADLHAEAEAGFARAVAAWLQTRGGREAATTARMIAAAAHGFKQAAADEPSYRALIRRFAAVVAASLPAG